MPVGQGQLGQLADTFFILNPSRGADRLRISNQRRGHLDCIDNQDLAALIYQRQKHLVNVFIWPVETRSTTLPEIQTIQGYNLVFWWHLGMFFCAASDP
jgi:hypothetical protein